MRNTSKLTSQEFEEVSLSAGTADHLEQELIKEHSKNAEPYFDERAEEIIKSMIKVMSEEQKEGEKKYEYVARMKKEVDEVLSV